MFDIFIGVRNAETEVLGNVYSGQVSVIRSSHLIARPG